MRSLRIMVDAPDAVIRIRIQVRGQLPPRQAFIILFPVHEPIRNPIKEQVVASCNLWTR